MKQRSYSSSLLLLYYITKDPNLGDAGSQARLFRKETPMPGIAHHLTPTGMQSLKVCPMDTGEQQLSSSSIFIEDSFWGLL